MDKVLKNHHMISRDGVWYFRRRVPKHLVSAFGKKVIQFSLKTKNFDEAAKRRNVEEVNWDARFQQAEDKAASGETFSPTLSRERAVEIVQEYVRKTN